MSTQIQTAPRTATCYGCAEDIFYNIKVQVWQHEATHSAVCGTREQIHAQANLNYDDPARSSQYATPCLSCQADDCDTH